MRLRFCTAVTFLVAWLALWPASVAFADALVVVKVRTPEGDPANGTVTLTRKGSDDSYSCTTDEGSCRLEGVPGGRYTVSLEPAEGERPDPETAMIPPSGRVSLIVSTE